MTLKSIIQMASDDDIMIRLYRISDEQKNLIYKTPYEQKKGARKN